MDVARRARWSNTTFLVGFLVALALFLWVLKPFLLTMVMAAVIAVVLLPVQNRLAALLGNRRTLAAWILTLLTFLLLLAPLTLIALRVVKEAVPVLTELAQDLGRGGVAHWLQAESPRPVRILYWKAQEAGLSDQIRDVLQNIAGWLGGIVAGLPSFAALVITDGTVLVVSLVWFFASGPRIASRIIESVPMEPAYTRDLFATFEAGVRTIILSSLLTAVIQGAMGFVAFYLVRLPYPLLLAAIMAFFSFAFSLIPILGSGLVWGPAGVWLILSGRVIAGIFIIAYGLLVLGSVDNVVKPFFTRNALRLPPALVFITLFGGIAAFGPVGALLGPLVAAGLGAFLRIWREDFLHLPPMHESGERTMEPQIPPSPYEDARGRPRRFVHRRPPPKSRD